MPIAEVLPLLTKLGWGVGLQLLLSKGLGWALPKLPTLPRAVIPALNVLSKIQKGASVLDKPVKVLTDAVGTAAPFALDIVGRGINAAGKTAGAIAGAGGKSVGAIAEAIGNMPKANNMTSDAQMQKYGRTPTVAAGDMFSGLGKAANVTSTSIGEAANTGLSAIGEAAGGGLQNIAQAMRLQKLLNELGNNPSLTNANAEVLSRAITFAGNLGK